MLSREVLKRIVQDSSNWINHNYVIVDLGCADGKNSISVYKEIIRAVRGLAPDLDISIYVVDLPSSSFGDIINTVLSGLKDVPRVHVYAVGKSFFTSLFAENQVDLFFSNEALNWLSEAPCPNASRRTTTKRPGRSGWL